MIHLKVRRAMTSLLIVITALSGLMTGCSKSTPYSTVIQQENSGAQDETVLESDAFAGQEEGTFEDPELSRSVELGIGQFRTTDVAVTYAEYMSILDKVISILSEDKLTEWKKLFDTAHASDQIMTRREGMVALYFAAELMGPNYYSYNNNAEGSQIFSEIEDAQGDLFWEEMWDCSYDMFPSVEAPTLNGEGSYVNAGYFYSMKRASLYNGKPVFDYDSKAKSMHPADEFRYTDAIKAACRLYDSYCEDKSRPMTASDTEVIANADVRRKSILASQTDMTVSGTRYYVSTDGDDQNDGRSEQSPWATLNKVNLTKLQQGDAVLLKRGDIWRGQALITQNGVTYSAYGEGVKPGIYGSPENGTGAEKWSLLDGTDNIWVFYKRIMDCGDIVIDGSMDIAEKVPVWWTGNRYVKASYTDHYEDHEEMMDKPSFNPKRDMEDLQYFNDIDYSDLGTQFPIYVYSYADRDGMLYLRCDSGNPGEIYGSIEFCCDPYNGSVINMNEGPGSVIDNLSVMYGGHAIECNGGKAVSNCEVGYMGAMTHTFAESETVYSGDGIIHTNNMLVENNYVHHVFNSGIAAGELSFAADDAYAKTEEIQGNNEIKGNLLEYTGGITLLNWEEEANELHMFKNVVIEDNYVLYSCLGGHNDTTASSVLGSLVFSADNIPTPCANENLIVKDNVFYCSDGALIISAMPEKYYPVYSGNTYCQYPYGTFAYWRFRDGSYRRVLNNDTTDIEDFVRNELGDADGKVIN